MTVDRNISKQLHAPGAKLDIFYFYWVDIPFTNRNVLHNAVLIGDVSLMEEVVALGAALDFPVRDLKKSVRHSPCTSTAR
jgi:hypothetical protein